MGSPRRTPRPEPRRSAGGRAAPRPTVPPVSQLAITTPSASNTPGAWGKGIQGPRDTSMQDLLSRARPGGLGMWSQGKRGWGEQEETGQGAQVEAALVMPPCPDPMHTHTYALRTRWLWSPDHSVTLGGRMWTPLSSCASWREWQAGSWDQGSGLEISCAGFVPTLPCFFQ